eukprot:TRINITY_DN8142_c0_g1_i1.p1 TRINITY_DN8142_c0_g1~~TRINITY_DN8142_c0_g1_i1.p1  ORF type:complete len:219 (+),score=58.81 TRINITY_DN8142_c0_g1_i1:34-657(+)
MSIYEDIIRHQQSLGYLGGRRTKKWSPPKFSLPRPEFKIFKDDSGERVSFKNHEDCFLPDEKKRQKEAESEPSKFKKLSVHVHFAKSKEAHDLNGKADLYVKVGEEMAGDEDNRLCFRTPYVKKSLSASLNWKANILYTPTPNSTFRLLLELWDDDLIKDDYIGGAVLALKLDSNGTAESMTQSKITVFDDDDKEAGEITVTIAPAY